MALLTAPDTIFSPVEVATLDALYPDRDGWFHFLYILSDRVQEDVGELYADGMRFLCRIEARPYKSSYGGGICWWLPTSRDDYDSQREADRMACDGVNLFSNYIPDAIPLWANYAAPVDGVVAFLHRWADLDADTRSRLWSEWEGLKA